MNEIASIESVAEAIYDLRSQIELVVDKKEIKPIFQIQYITLCVFQVEIFGAAVSHGGWAGAVVGIVQVGGAIEAILLVCFWSKREELSFTFERSKPSTHVQTKYKYRYTHKNHN